MWVVLCHSMGTLLNPLSDPSHIDVIGPFRTADEATASGVTS